MVDRILLSVIQFISKPVYASLPPAPPSFRPPPSVPSWPPKLEELATAFDGLIDKIYPFGVMLAVGVLIFGGYMWIISGGDPGRKQQAQGTLTWGVIGLVFLFLIKAILTLVVNYFYN